MKQYFTIMKGVLMLRESPQAMPSSPPLMWLTLIVFLIVSLAVGSSVYSLKSNIGITVFEAALLLLFTQFALQFRAYPERFMQTVTALFGVRIVLNLVAWPMVIKFSAGVDQNQSLNALLGVFMLLLLMYGAIALAHILRHALAVSLQKAVIISIAYYFVSIVLVSIMFPSPLAV